jgi:RNA polymerase sigma factor (sigma-70 family)
VCQNHRPNGHDPGSGFFRPGCDDLVRRFVLSSMGADGSTQGVNSGFGQILDPELLRQARRGKGSAFEAVYRIYGRACFNLALRILGDPSAAEDIVQDVFLRMMATVSKFRGDAPFGIWLKRMAVNSTIDALRRNRRLDAEDPTSRFEGLIAEDVSPERRVDAWSLLMQLTARERAVVVLHEMEGYTHKELALLFEQSESYSKSILARSLQRLGASDDVDIPRQGDS